MGHSLIHVERNWGATWRGYSKPPTGVSFKSPAENTGETTKNGRKLRKGKKIELDT